MPVQLSKMSLALVNQQGPILLHDNVHPHVARMTVQKLTDLGYETLPNPTNYYFSKHLASFFMPKNIPF